MSSNIAHVPGVFPLWPSERPSVAEAKAWFEAAKPSLLPDWQAMLSGLTPRSLMPYEPRSLPAVLVVSPDLAVPGAVTPVQVATREALIQQVTDENAVRARQLASHTADIENAFFSAIEVSMRGSAPLLIKALQASHPLAFHPDYHSGSRTWIAMHLRFVGANAVALTHESDEHDDHLVELNHFCQEVLAWL